MSKAKEEEDFEFDESVSSNLSFLNDEDTRDKQPAQVGEKDRKMCISVQLCIIFLFVEAGT